MDHRIVLDRVRKRLTEAAIQHKLVFYEDILANPEFGVTADESKRNFLGSVLAEISHFEVMQGRPPLSAVCVRKAGGTPGPEFRSFMDPANQLNEQQLKGMWQFMRDEVFKSWQEGEKAA